MKEFRNAPNYGAVERVLAYIADAYVWEKNAMPPNQELESQLRSYIASKKSGTLNDQNPSIHEKLKQRGRDLVDSRKLRFESLKNLAELHWVGDAWKEEALTMWNPPKHDPALVIADASRELCCNPSCQKERRISMTKLLYWIPINRSWRRFLCCKSFLSPVPVTKMLELRWLSCSRPSLQNGRIHYKYCWKC